MFLHFCLVDFDRLPLWSAPIVVPLPVPFCSHGINLGFFCWFDWSIYLWCAIRFGRVAFNRSIHEISLVWYAVWLYSEFRLCPLIFCICFAIGFSSLDFFLIVDVIGFIILGFTWSFVVSPLLCFQFSSVNFTQLIDGIGFSIIGFTQSSVVSLLCDCILYLNFLSISCFFSIKQLKTHVCISILCYL